MKRASKIEVRYEFQRMIAQLEHELATEPHPIDASYIRARIRALRDQLILIS